MQDPLLAHKPNIETDFLDELLSILRSGNFFSSPDKISEGDIHIGDLTPYEQALLTMHAVYSAHGTELVEAYTLQGAYIGPSDYEAKFIAEYEGGKFRLEALDSLLWGSIKQRLCKGRMIANQHIGLGIREGNKVVELPKKPELDISVQVMSLGSHRLLDELAADMAGTNTAPQQ